MALKSFLSADLSLFFNTDEFAETVSYNGQDISAIFTSYKDQEERHSDFIKAELTVKFSDITSPQYRDKVVIDGVTWRVSDIIAYDEYIYKIEIQTDEKPKV